MPVAMIESWGAAEPSRDLKRNLLYHILPVKHRWERSVEQLLRRWGIFNGRKIIAIMTSPGGPVVDVYTNRGALELDPPEQVKAAFGERAAEIEWLHFPNDPRLREVVSFVPLWATLFARPECRGQNQLTFYAHAKGATWPTDKPIVHEWADVLYETLLDYLPLVEELLGAFPIVGSLKTHVRWWRQSKAAWNYAGSFWWARNADVWIRSWRRINRFWSGNEAWPGITFQDHEAGVVFYDWFANRTDPYHPDTWAPIWRALNPWRATNAARRTRAP